MAFLVSNIFWLLWGSVYLKKYHEEFAKVSIVSVSLLALELHLGHFTFTHFSFVNKGLPSPNVTSFGSLIGNSDSETGVIPHFLQ